MANKIDQAEELIKKAQKCLKTSFLKWSPDIDSAVEYYSKAAVIYRNAKMLQESADIYMQIADLHAKNKSFFHCAKAYETASLLFRDLGNFDKVVECIGTAGQLLRQNGVPDSASTLYAKGAKGLEGNMPEESARFYECAADTSEVEEKYLQAADFAGQSARLWTRLRRFNEADRLLRYQMRLCSLGASGENVHTAYQVCGKAVVALVILKLVQEDSVAAGKAYEEAVEQYHFNETNDAVAVAKLLQAYEPYDSAAMAEVITLPTFRNLETEALLRGREQLSTSVVKQSLDNLAEVSERLLHTASNIQSQFESNEKQSNEAGSESPSFLDEVEVKTDSMDTLLKAVKLLQDEIRRLPELIEASERKFQEELTQHYEEQLEKALSSAIETCLAISKEKIDELTSFVIEDLPEL